MAKKVKKPSNYYFYYKWPLCHNPNYPNLERPDHPYLGKLFHAQLLMWSVETNTARVRLYDVDTGECVGTHEISADDWVSTLSAYL